MPPDDPGAPPPPDDPPAPARRRLEAVVRGRVQGVGFRYFVLREASALGLDGWVANQGDGSVRCVAEGPDDALEALLARVRDGPAGAHVRGVEVAWRAPGGEGPGFRIRAGAHGGD